MERQSITTKCDDPPNPTLVSAKRTLLKEKQQTWEKAKKTFKLDGVSMRGQMETNQFGSPISEPKVKRTQRNKNQSITQSAGWKQDNC